MLVRSCSKSFKTGFSSTWNENFQMYKVGFEKAKEPEIKLPTFIGSQRMQRNSRKMPTSASLTTWKPLTVWISQMWKILKEMGIPDHLTCLLRNLYVGQKAIVRNLHGTMVLFKIGERVQQGCVLSPCLFNFYAEYIMRNTGLDELQARLKIAGRNISNLRYADDTTLMSESEEELKSLLMRVKEESEKAGLKLTTFRKLRWWLLVPSLHGK